MQPLHRCPLILLLGLTAAGCSATPQELTINRLSAEAPSAVGYPARPQPAAVMPISEQPFGLYAEAPSHDTLVRLSTGMLSPDGRYRAALVNEQIWVGRIDGAWVWHVTLPAPPPPPPPPERIGPEPEPPPAPQQPYPVSPVRWTNRGTLTVRDQNGVWYEASPTLARVGQLAAAFAGKEGLTFSPDMSQAYYYQNDPKGKQLWAAQADGKNPRLIGVNLVGHWTVEGELQATTPATNGPNDIEPDNTPGMQSNG